MMTAPPHVTLRPAHEPDWPLIERWLRLEEVQRWWGSHTAAQAAVIAALQADMGLCSIIAADGVPAGYAQALDTEPLAFDPPLLETAGTFRTDVFIGERDYRGKGIGQAALRLVAGEVFETTLAVALIAVVAVRHEPAVRAHEKAGFRWVRVVDDPLSGPSWLMRLERAGSPEGRP